MSASSELSSEYGSRKTVNSLPTSEELLEIYRKNYKDFGEYIEIISSRYPEDAWYELRSIFYILLQEVFDDSVNNEDFIVEVFTKWYQGFRREVRITYMAYLIKNGNNVQLADLLITEEISQLTDDVDQMLNIDDVYDALLLILDDIPLDYWYNNMTWHERALIIENTNTFIQLTIGYNYSACGNEITTKYLPYIAKLYNMESVLIQLNETHGIELNYQELTQEETDELNRAERLKGGNLLTRHLTHINI